MAEIKTYELTTEQIAQIEASLLSITGRAYFSGGDGNISSYRSTITDHGLYQMTLEKLMTNIPEQEVWDDVEDKLGYDLKNAILLGADNRSVFKTKSQVERLEYMEDAIEMIILTSSGKTSITTHATNFADSKGFQTLPEFLNSVGITFAKVLLNPVYHPNNFSDNPQPEYWLPKGAKNNTVFQEFLTYLTGILGTLDGHYTERFVEKWEREEFRIVNMELRTGSSGLGITVGGNTTVFNGLVTLGSSLIQSIGEGEDKPFRLRYRIEWNNVLTVGQVGVGVGKPTSNAITQVKYPLIVNGLAANYRYGQTAGSTFDSGIAQSNDHLLETGYDGTDLYHAYSTDNGATWTEIHRFEDVTGSFPIRALVAGQITVMLGTVEVKDMHVTFDFA